MRFELDPEQVKKFEKWRDEQEVKMAKLQGLEEACHGAIGGAYTFSFTTTSIGTACTVRNSVTKEELNLTDYGNW